MENSMRRFTAKRTRDGQKAQGEGVVWSDGKIALRFPPTKFVLCFESEAEMLHSYECGKVTFSMEYIDEEVKS